MSVNKEIDLSKIEQKAYLSYHRDGLADILIGLFILAFGIDMAVGTLATSLLGWMPVLLYWPLKRLITYPRMGYVDFSPERKTKEKKKSVVLTIALCVPFTLGLLVFLVVSGRTGLSPELVDKVREYSILIFGVILASFISLGAFLSGVRHLYAYAALILIFVASGRLLDVQRHLYFISSGVVILISGVIVLIRFLRKYPRNAEEVHNGESS